MATSNEEISLDCVRLSVVLPGMHWSIAIRFHRHQSQVDPHSLIRLWKACLIPWKQGSICLNTITLICMPGWRDRKILSHIWLQNVNYFQMGSCAVIRYLFSHDMRRKSSNTDFYQWNQDLATYITTIMPESDTKMHNDGKQNLQL
jgi:hypothetical protein